MSCNIVKTFYSCDRDDDIARYTAAGQALGALGTLTTLVYVVSDNLKRNKIEREREQRELIQLWSQNMPIIRLLENEYVSLSSEEKFNLSASSFFIQNYGNANAFYIKLKISSYNLSVNQLEPKQALKLEEVLSAHFINHIEFYSKISPKIPETTVDKINSIPDEDARYTYDSKDYIELTYSPTPTGEVTIYVRYEIKLSTVIGSQKNLSPQKYKKYSIKLDSFSTPGYK